MARLFFIVFISVVGALCSGCRWFQNSFIGPSELADTVSLASWRPCVVVQNPGFRGDKEFEVQMQEVEKLYNAGTMRWMRLGGANLKGHALDYAIEAKSMGLNVIGGITLADLESLGWENTYDRMKQIFGSNVDIWQIGGEIANTDPSVNLVTMSPEEYVPKLRNLYNHIKERYPGDTITSAPTYGSIPGPREEFEKLIHHGLLDIETDPTRSRNLIITIHVYTSNALEDYGKVFNRYNRELSQKRIWVTETGRNNVSEQINWVNRFYPSILNTVHPEMICWYVLWAGDEPGGHNEHGLINNVNNGLPLVESDLFIQLSGGAQ